MKVFQWVQRGEEVILFDNSLRIESEARIFRAGKWQQRYVVCQRRSLTEAPLVGIFKNDLSREGGDVLDLFYLPNYIGYEWGFKLKGTNKTLAIIVQDETLILSFQLRQALVMTQDVPPQQRLHLNLDKIFDVHCSAGQFAFHTHSPSQTQPYAFLLFGERLYDLSVRLRLLLRPNQFGDYAKRMDVLPTGGADETTAAARARSVSTVLPPSSSVQPLSTLMPEVVGGANEHSDEDEEQYENFGATPKRSLPSNINLAVSFPVGGSQTPVERASVAAAAGESEPEGAYAVPELEENTPPHQVISRLDSIEHSTAAATLFLNPSSVMPQENSKSMGGVVGGGGGGMPPPFGLVKPSWPVVMGPGVGGGDCGPAGDSSPFGKSLSRRLRKSLSGSYSRYDGERVAHDDGRGGVEDEEAEERDEGSGDRFAAKQRPPPPPVPPPHASAVVKQEHAKATEPSQAKGRSSGGGWKSRITATLSVPLQKSGKLKKATVEPPELTPSSMSRLKPKGFRDGGLSASAHCHLNSRIDSAIAKGRERLRQSNRKSSNMSSSNTTRTASSGSESSSIDRLDAFPSTRRRRPPAPPPPPLSQLQRIEHIVVDIHNVLEEKPSAHSNPSHTSSISTLAVTNPGAGGAAEEGVESESSSSRVVSVYDPATPPVVPGSRTTLGTASQGADWEKAWKPPSANDRADGLSLASSVSVRSELDARVQFRRGGRSRVSSSHSKASSKRRGSVSPTPPSLRRPSSPHQQIQSQPALTTLLPGPLGTLQLKRLEEGSTQGQFLPAEYAEIGEDLAGNLAAMSNVRSPNHATQMSSALVGGEVFQAMGHKKSTQSSGSFRFPTAEVDYVSICPNTPPTPRQQLPPNEPNLTRRTESATATTTETEHGRRGEL